jgi:hypothetical protein
MCYACTVISLSLTTALVITATEATAAATVSKYRSQGTAHDVNIYCVCTDAFVATSNDR